MELTSNADVFPADHFPAPSLGTLRTWNRSHVLQIWSVGAGGHTACYPLAEGYRLQETEIAAATSIATAAASSGASEPMDAAH